MATSRNRHEQAQADRLRVEGVQAGWPFARIAEEIYDRCHQEHGTTMLRAHRLARGWAPDTVLDEVRARLRDQAGRDSSIDRALLSNWESGRLKPGPRYLPILLGIYQVNTLAPGSHSDDRSASADLERLCAMVLRTTLDQQGQPPFEWARKAAIRDVAESIEDTVSDQLQQILDEGREAMARTFVSESVGSDRLALFQHTLAQRRLDHRYSPPVPMLAQLLLDWFEVQALLGQRQPTRAQRGLYSIAAPTGLLIADTLMKLGKVEQARQYYALAQRAAADSGSQALTALVPAQQAMLPYYFGNTAEALTLAERAQRLAGDTVCVGLALGAAMEARIRARLAAEHPANLSFHREAMETWDQARQVYTRLNAQQCADMALGFPLRRHFFYDGSTAGFLGRTADFTEARRRATGHYPPQALDLCLMDLDLATCIARVDPDRACAVAVQAVRDLSQEHRTHIVIRRLKEITALLPVRAQRSLCGRELRQLTVHSHD